MDFLQWILAPEVKQNKLRVGGVTYYAVYFDGGYGPLYRVVTQLTWASQKPRALKVANIKP
jgi:hypothetical protein